MYIQFKVMVRLAAYCMAICTTRISFLLIHNSYKVSCYFTLICAFLQLNSYFDGLAKVVCIISQISWMKPFYVVFRVFCIYVQLPRKMLSTRK